MISKSTLVRRHLFEGVVNSKTDKKGIDKKEMILWSMTKRLLKKEGYTLRELIFMQIKFCKICISYDRFYKN